MAEIKVKCGGCGITYKDGNGVDRHALKTPEHGPFECDDAQAARLVALGVAEYIGTVKAVDEVPALQPEGKQMEPEATQEPEKKMGHLSAEDLEAMDYNALKKLAADMGVVPNGKRKSDYIAAIAAVEVELGPKVDPDEEDDPDNVLPVLTAADPE